MFIRERFTALDVEYHVEGKLTAAIGFKDFTQRRLDLRWQTANQVAAGYKSQCLAIQFEVRYFRDRTTVTDADDDRGIRPVDLRIANAEGFRIDGSRLAVQSNPGGVNRHLVNAAVADLRIDGCVDVEGLRKDVHLGAIDEPLPRPSTCTMSYGSTSTGPAMSCDCPQVRWMSSLADWFTWSRSLIVPRTIPNGISSNRIRTTIVNTLSDADWRSFEIIACIAVLPWTGRD